MPWGALTRWLGAGTAPGWPGVGPEAGRMLTCGGPAQVRREPGPGVDWGGGTGPSGAQSIES